MVVGLSTGLAAAQRPTTTTTISRPLTRQSARGNGNHQRERGRQLRELETQSGTRQSRHRPDTQAVAETKVGAQESSHDSQERGGAIWAHPLSSGFHHCTVSLAVAARAAPTRFLATRA